ncbi:MAG: phosphoglycerate dehydrogenase, partial [Oscillospiraceae bacterium]
EELYAQADYITLHIPCTDQTKNAVNAAAIAKMKEGVRVINLARGELVRDEDMLAALQSGAVARYVTDFPNNVTANAAGVVAIPHLGASTPESEDNCAIMAAQELRDYLENGNIKNSVNFPNLTQERSGVCRLCLIHKNIPAMLASITAALSGEHVNVENLTNKSRGDWAYTIVDVNTDVSPRTETEIAAIDGMIRVRVLH